MDQLSTKSKKCKSIVCCIVCLNSTSSGDFVKCQKCYVSIHKDCFKLSGDLLKIFQDFQERNEKFPFTILCPGCSQFTHEHSNERVEDCENKTKIKNPFAIDCIIQVILENLNIQELLNIRLVNTLWNQNTCRILSNESRQIHLEAYQVKGSNLDLEKCLQFVKNSKNKSFFQKLAFDLKGDQNQNTNYGVFNEIIKITKPKHVLINNVSCILQLEQYTLFSTFLTNISENVVDLTFEFREKDRYDYDSTQFSLPKFSKLKSLTIKYLIPEYYNFIQILIENSPKLKDFSLDSCNTDASGQEIFSIDSFVDNESKLCILSENFAKNLQLFKLLDAHCNNLGTCCFQMKLKTLSLIWKMLSYQFINYEKLVTFLSSQNDTLEKLKIQFYIREFELLSEIEGPDEITQLDLPILDNVQHFSLEFNFNPKNDIVYNTEKEIWPTKPIYLTEKLPNLKKITIKFCKNWELSFETEKNCHPGVTELELNRWVDRDLTKFVNLFPHIETLILEKFSYSEYEGEKIYTQLGNLNGWSKSLKRIEISCEYYHLENLDFEKFVCLKNLKSIKISKTSGPGSEVNSSHFIYPDFKPLFKIPTLSQVAIKNFKISKGIIYDLREKYPSLDYSFYSKTNTKTENECENESENESDS